MLTKKGRSIEQFFFIVTDTLSLGDRMIDNMDRHAGQNRPRNQLLADPSGLKPKVEPMFDYSQNTNVTALIGKTAYLTCRVRNLGDKTVRPFATFIIFDSDLYCPLTLRKNLCSSIGAISDRSRTFISIRELFLTCNAGITRKIARDSLMSQKNACSYTLHVVPRNFDKFVAER